MALQAQPTVIVQLVFTYPDSIFQQDWTRTTRYAAIDRDIIRLLYDPSLDVGLDDSELDCVLADILITWPD